MPKCSLDGYYLGRIPYNLGSRVGNLRTKIASEKWKASGGRRMVRGAKANEHEPSSYDATCGGGLARLCRCVMRDSGLASGAVVRLWSAEPAPVG